MMETTPRQPKRLLMAGDWHGHLLWAFKVINYAAHVKADTILHLGDFGWWSAGVKTWQYLREVNKELTHHGITMYWIDGNHEDHSFWHHLNGPHAHPYYAQAYPNIVHLPRGYRWDWWGDTWMAVGGAYSVDRGWSTEGKGWWEGEALTSEQFDYCTRAGKVDIIVAHDAPREAPIPGIAPDKDIWLRTNRGLRRVPDEHMIGANDHRRLLQEICNRVQPTEFYHGHYHKAYEGLCPIEDGRDVSFMTVRGLDRDGTTFSKNTHLITCGLEDDDNES